MALGLGTILGIANAGLGLSGSLSQRSAANGLTARARRQQDEALRLERQDLARRQEARRQLDASGAFDPTAQENLARADIDAAQARAQGNQAAQARVLGYRPGDSAPLTRMRATGQEYNLRLAGVLQGIRQQAYQRKVASLSIDDPSRLASALMQQSQMNAAQGAYGTAQAGANFGNVLTGALTSIPNAPARPGVVAGTTFQDAYPDARASTDESGLQASYAGQSGY